MEKIKVLCNYFLSPHWLCCSSRSVVSNSETPWTAAHQVSRSFTVSQSLLKLRSTESVMLFNHLILWRPLLLMPSIFPSIRWPKYWSFSFSISPSNDYSGLISFRMDWLDLLVVQGTLKSILQHHSLKTWILWSSAFFMVQLSHPYMTIVVLTIWIFFSKVMSLLFNVLSRFVIAFLPRNKHLLISWLQSPSTVIFKLPKIKFIIVSISPHLFAIKWWDQMPWS